MEQRLRRALVWFLSISTTWFCAYAASAMAQYPTKPVRVIVATGAGGSDDFIARSVSAKLTEVLGQSFVVENRPGAGGMIAQNSVAKSEPDGYTLLAAGGSMAGARYVNANMGYDLLHDFQPISLLVTNPFTLLVNPALPVRSVKEFVSLARSQPGKLTFATLGAGQIPYWGALYLNTTAGIDALEVQYRNPADMITDIIAGRVDYAVMGIFNAVTYKEKLRVLGVTSRARSEMLPDVPAIAETLPTYEMPAWVSLMGPAGMRAEVVQVINKAAVRGLASPDLVERLAKAGYTAASSTPEELRKRYEEWMAIFGKIAKDANIKPQ
jgi:tripartite-type tricarboxylate transporter receptor subunit TctC